MWEMGSWPPSLYTPKSKYHQLNKTKSGHYQAQFTIYNLHMKKANRLKPEWRPPLRVITLTGSTPLQEVSISASHQFNEFAINDLDDYLRLSIAIVGGGRHKNADRGCWYHLIRCSSYKTMIISGNKISLHLSITNNKHNRIKLWEQ